MLLVCYWPPPQVAASARRWPQRAQQSLSPAPCTPSPGSLSSSRSNLPGHFSQAIASALLCSKVALQASSLFCKVALVGSVGDPLEASPLCSKVALADSVEDPLEASPLCSTVVLTHSVEDPLEASPLCSKAALAGSVVKLPWFSSSKPPWWQKCWGFPVAN